MKNIIKNNYNLKFNNHGNFRGFLLDKEENMTKTFKRKDNYLLFTGLILLFFAIVAQNLIQYYLPEKLPSTDRFGDFENIFIIFFAAIIYAPIVEELVFRGYFLKKKIYTYLFFAGAVFFIIQSETYYAFVVLFLLAILEFVIKTQRKTKIIYFLSTLLFALIHYKASHFTNVYSIIPVFFQFSIGLMLLWITINYNLFKSMLFHFCVNFFVIGSLILALQFPNEKVKTITENELVLTYHKTPVIGNENFTFTPSEVKSEITTIRLFAKLLKVEDKKYKINDSLRFFRYNFNLKNVQGKSIESKEAEKVLRKAKLIE